MCLQKAKWKNTFLKQIIQIQHNNTDDDDNDDTNIEIILYLF